MHYPVITRLGSEYGKVCPQERAIIRSSDPSKGLRSLRSQIISSGRYIIYTFDIPCLLDCGILRVGSSVLISE